MTALGTAEAAAGELGVGRLPIGEHPDGASLSLPVAVLEGADDGPTLYVQAGSDGDELNGVATVGRLLRRLDPAAVSGTILVVAVANLPGFRQSTHRNPIDDTKLNRAYPGDPEGSTSERIAAATFEAAARADLVLDLHQGSTSRMIDEVRVRCGRHHELHEECLELAKVFDCGYVLDQQGPDGQLARAVCDEGVPAVDPELGGSVGVDESSVEVGLRGLENVLAAYGLVDGEPERRRQTRVRGFDQYHSPRGGLTELAVDLGAEVDRGDELYHVHSLLGEHLETVTADDPGVLWRARRRPHVTSGEYVCSVGIDVDVY
ncbi:MAG: succinylglutamate desuccinylase/aspartoacylase family protein [Halobacteriales archaeon]